MFVWSKCGDLQNIWSMRVPDFFELRVGRVILGKKLLVHFRSKNSSTFSVSFICKIFILKSPTIAAYLFSFWSVLIMGEISSINLSTLALLSLLWSHLHNYYCYLVLAHFIGLICHDYTVGKRRVALTMIPCCSITPTPTAQSKVWWWPARKMVVIYFKWIDIHCYLARQVPLLVNWGVNFWEAWNRSLHKLCETTMKTKRRCGCMS